MVLQNLCAILNASGQETACIAARRNVDKIQDVRILAAKWVLNRRHGGAFFAYSHIFGDPFGLPARCV